MIIKFTDGTEYDDELLIMNQEELLRCRRNELVPENPQVLKRGIEGLLEYRINRNKRHPDCIYQGYDEAEHKYFGKSKTADYFELLYGIDPFEIGGSNTIFNCWSFLSRFIKGMSMEHWTNEEYALLRETMNARNEALVTTADASSYSINKRLVYLPMVIPVKIGMMMNVSFWTMYIMGKLGNLLFYIIIS